jgi:PAP2 superfamily
MAVRQQTIQVIYATVILILFLAVSPALADSNSNGKSADDISAKVATTWFELLYDIVKAEKTTPPQASRIYGITALALYESIVSGAKAQRSLAGQLNDLTTLPRAPIDAGLHWPAVANVAIANTIRGVYGEISPNTLGHISKLEETFASEFRSNNPAHDYERSAAHGRAVSEAILAWATTDGFAAHNKCPYIAPSSEPGRWRATPPAFMPNPLQPCWGQLRPMALRSGKECAAPGPPKFSNNTNSELYAAATEVYKVGLQLSSEQKIIADYWADNPGDTGTPPGHWVDIVSQIVRTQKLSLAKAAEAYARVGIAAHDAFIGCWYTKYLHNLKRPVTYINDNVQGQWRSYVATPAFPSYPSGHSVQSGAVAHVLTDMFGPISFRDMTHVNHGTIPSQQPRTFRSFQDAAAEAAISRLYGGIHYLFDNNDGLASGECIGRIILERVKFNSMAKPQ